MKKGVLIAFEGVDGCGKTTQTHMLHDWLLAHNILSAVYQFPTKDTGVYNILLSEMISGRGVVFKNAYSRYLLYTYDRYNQQDAIKADIESGKVVLCDRYVASGCVYGNVCHGIEMDWAVNVEKYVTKPDVTVHLIMGNIIESLYRNEMAGKPHGMYDEFDV